MKARLKTVAPSDAKETTTAAQESVGHFDFGATQELEQATCLALSLLHQWSLLLTEQANRMSCPGHQDIASGFVIQENEARIKLLRAEERVFDAFKKVDAVVKGRAR